MPAHDWTRVDAGIFHHFHGAWITHLAESLNDGLLPEGYYALAEQRATHVRPDVLALHFADHPTPGTPLAVAERPPRVTVTRQADADVVYRLARRTLTIRHKSGHRIVALIEIVSPANKDRRQSVAEFVQKVYDALDSGVSVLMVDLFPPGKHDPTGLHPVIWQRYEDEMGPTIAERPLTLASYAAADLPRAYVEPLAVGDPLREMPLFLDPEWYISIPLELPYDLAWRGFPAVWKDVIESD